MRYLNVAMSQPSAPFQWTIVEGEQPYVRTVTDLGRPPTPAERVAFGREVVNVQKAWQERYPGRPSRVMVVLKTAKLAYDDAQMRNSLEIVKLLEGAQVERMAFVAPEHATLRMQMNRMLREAHRADVRWFTGEPEAIAFLRGK